MLYITMHEGDYFMVGDNVKIVFDHSRGRNQVFIGVDAPRDVQVLRGEIYENKVAELAVKGDRKAQTAKKKILADYETGTGRYGAQKASQAEHARQVLAGEIKPTNEHDRKLAATAKTRQHAQELSEKLIQTYDEQESKYNMRKESRAERAKEVLAGN